MWEKGGTIYALHRSIQRTHHVHVQWLCKTVIHYAAINAWRDRSRRRQKEISLEYLTEEKHHPLGTNDKCFQAPEPDEEYILNLCGDTVILNNGLLVQALSRLPVEEQEMLYLSFYRRLSQEKIGKRYGRSRSATGYHIRKSIRRLYEEMEGMTHEE